MYQLRQRLKRAGISISELARIGETDIQDESESSPSRLKAHLHRRWTHNEQLIVLPCGIVTSRATFFSAEGVISVKVITAVRVVVLLECILIEILQQFLQATYPDRRLLPTFVFYDKACHLLSHLKASGDTYFTDVAFVVDVFHAHNKHHETDTFCNINCNPAHFQELVDSEEKWVFNSSAAEQVNAWFGGFQSMTREMTVARYALQSCCSAVY